MSDDQRLLLLGTHDFYIYSVTFDPVAKTLMLCHTLKMREDPSWITRHRTRTDLVYANSHVDRKLYTLRVTDQTGKLEVQQEIDSGGIGPTHIELLADESAIVVAHFGRHNVGRVTLVPLNKDGLFASTKPLHVYSPDFYGTIAHKRMENPHVHGVYLHQRTGDIFAPDLGTNNVLRLSCSVDGGIQKRGTAEGFDPTDGPRHAQLHPSGDYLYTLAEIGSALIIHKINDDGSSRLLQRYTILPECDRENPEMCATEIIHCPALQPGYHSLLICANRYSVNPDGDALALFTVSPDGSEVVRASQPWLYGAGHHLRGVACDPKTARYVAVLAREKGGMTMYERVGEQGLELDEVARLPDINKTVVPAWIS